MLVSLVCACSVVAISLQLDGDITRRQSEARSASPLSTPAVGNRRFTDGHSRKMTSNRPDTPAANPAAPSRAVNVPRLLTSNHTAIGSVQRPKVHAARLSAGSAHLRFPPALRRATAYAPFVYTGNPVMLGTVNIYYVFYGSWTTAAAQIMLDMIPGMSGSPWMNIETTYYSSAGACSGNLNLAATYYDTTRSQGSTLTTSTVQSAIAHAINSGAMPLDTNGVYLLLTDASTTINGMCTSYCGWYVQFLRCDMCALGA